MSVGRVLYEDEKLKLVYVPEDIKGQGWSRIYEGYYLKLPTNNRWYQLRPNSGTLFRVGYIHLRDLLDSIGEDDG